MFVSVPRKIKNLFYMLFNPTLLKSYVLLRQYTMIAPSTYIANLKIAKSAAGIKGSIVECGTWKGGMIAGIARALGPRRNYYLFDSFEGLPEAEPIDGDRALKWQKNKTSPYYYDNCKASKEDAQRAMEIGKAKKTSQFVKGWFEDTLPGVDIAEGISILRMDADWYSSTYQILDSFFSQVVAGGYIIIDDYYAWEGCSKAVHDYLAHYKRPERIYSERGVAYIIKISDCEQ
jgi:O-methyltransferase